MNPNRCSSFLSAHVVPGAPSSIPGLSGPFGLEQARSRANAGTTPAPSEEAVADGPRGGLRRKLMRVTRLGLIGHFYPHVRCWLGSRRLRDGSIEKLLGHGVRLSEPG